MSSTWLLTLLNSNGYFKTPTFCAVFSASHSGSSSSLSMMMSALGLLCVVDESLLHSVSLSLSNAASRSCITDASLLSWRWRKYKPMSYGDSTVCMVHLIIVIPLKHFSDGLLGAIDKSHIIAKVWLDVYCQNIIFTWFSWGYFP